MSHANNHSYDFGPTGQADTVRALHSAGKAQTGLPGEITVVRAHGLRIAVLGDTASRLDVPAQLRPRRRSRRLRHPRVRLSARRRFLSGRVSSVRLVGAGMPVPDPAGTGARLVSERSRDDLGARAVAVTAAGRITAR